MMPEKPKKSGKAPAKPSSAEQGVDLPAKQPHEAVDGDSERGDSVRKKPADLRKPDEVAAEVRERFAEIRQSDRPPTDLERNALVKDLLQRLETIENQVAPEAPDAAFELLWSVLKLAPNICEIKSGHDDGNSEPEEEYDYVLGEVGKATEVAIDMIQNLSPRLSLEPEDFADKLFDGLMDDKVYVFSDLLADLGDALGERGFQQLKFRVDEFELAPLEETELLAQGPVPRSHQIYWANDARKFKASLIREDIADAEGNVDDWLDCQSEDWMETCHFAFEAAERLMEAGREEEALRILERRIAKGKDPSNDGVSDSKFFWKKMMEVHRECLKAVESKG